MTAHRRTAILPTLVVALALGAVGGCENKVDDTPNNLPQSSDAKVEEVSAECAGCDCLKADTWYRFTTLELVSLDGDPKHSVIAVLNGLWASDIKNKELNFYMHIQEVSATEVKTEIVNGAREANGTEVCLLDYTRTPVVHPRAGCCLKDSGLAGMNVYAGTPIHPKNCAPTLDVPNAIPVRQSILQAMITDNAADGCTTIDGKVTQGVLSLASLKKTCTCLNPGQPAEKCEELIPSYDDGKDPGCGGCNSKFQNLHSLLSKFKPPLSFSCKDADGGPATCLTARYDAVRIDAPPPLCK